MGNIDENLQRKNVARQVENFCSSYFAAFRALKFSNISDEELDRRMTEAAEGFPFCGEQMLKFEERGIKEVSRKLRPRSPDFQMLVLIGQLIR